VRERERESEGGIYLVMLVAKLSQSESTESHRLVPLTEGNALNKSIK